MTCSVVVGHLRLLYEKSKNNCVRSCFKIVSRGRRQQNLQLECTMMFVTLGPLQLSQAHQRMMWDHFDSKIFPDEDGASKLTIETSRNFVRPLRLRQTIQMKISREILFWIFNPAQRMPQKTYNWNIPISCWWNQLPWLVSSTGTHFLWRYSLFKMRLLLNALLAVPQIANIISTYHNSNLVIARRFQFHTILWLHLSPVAWDGVDDLFVTEVVGAIMLACAIVPYSFL